MQDQLIQNWTHSKVALSDGANRDVLYKVIKSGTRLFQEIRDVEANLVHRLELPRGIPLEKSSYEVLLRYVLVDVVAGQVTAATPLPQ